MSKNLNISFHKIKAHFGKPGNELADNLAKEGWNISPNNIDYKCIPGALMWDSIGPIDRDIRKFGFAYYGSLYIRHVLENRISTCNNVLQHTESKTYNGLRPKTGSNITTLQTSVALTNQA